MAATETARLAVLIDADNATASVVRASSRADCRSPDSLHGMRMVGIVPMRLEER